MILFFVGLFFGPFVMVLFIIDLIYLLYVAYPRPYSGRYFDLFRSGWFLAGFLVSLALIAAAVLYVTLIR